MKCPQCNNELVIPGGSLKKALNSPKNIAVKTICCCRLISIKPKVQFYISKY